MLGRTKSKPENRLRPAWRVTIGDHVIGLAWSADGTRLAAAAVGGPVHVFDSPSGKVVHELPGHGFGTTTIAYQPNGSLLATSGQDGNARLWKDGIEVAVLPGGSAWVEVLAWNSDGSILATGAGKKVRLWDASGRQLAELPPQPSTVYALAWRPRTNHLTIAAYGGVTLWDSTTQVRAFQWKGSPLVARWSPDGKLLAHGNQDATVHFWYADTGKDLQMYGYAHKVKELCWDFTSRYLATGGGSLVCVWDCGGKGPEGSKPQMLEGHAADSHLAAVAYQHRGYLLASAGRDGKVLLWQLGNKKTPLIGSDQFETEATALAWAKDDNSLAAGSDRGDVTVHRTSQASGPC
jgi:WD40 repeat protein